MPVTINQLTNIDGTGVFDLVSGKVQSHLKAERDAGRITGVEYSKVYIAMIQGSMEQSIRFLFESVSSDLVAKQIELADQNLIKAAKELELMDQQIINAKVEVAKSQVEKEILSANLVNIPKEGQKLDAEIALIPKEGKLADQRILDMQGNVEIKAATVEKVQAEVYLLQQKNLTERAQITAEGVDAESVVGLQRELYKGQIDGLVNDAVQKATKILTETWTVRQTTDGAQVSTENLLEDVTIGGMIHRLMATVDARQLDRIPDIDPETGTPRGSTPPIAPWTPSNPDE